MGRRNAKQMAQTVKQHEQPATAGYPYTTSQIERAAWERIESYIAFRWPEHEVEWRVEGPGEWRPPLTPATIATVEIWSEDDADWVESIDVEPAPEGYFFPHTGPYRIIATVGDNEITIPNAVREAVRRLAEYLAASPGKPGATSERIEAGSISLAHSRDADHMAKAIQNSGAADLLRRYRRA